MRKRTAFYALVAGVALSAGGADAADKPLIGIVSIAATEANNVRYIKGAETAATELGWEVSVIDAAGSADQANAGIQNFAQRGAHAIIDMVFPVSSIGAGLEWILLLDDDQLGRIGQAGFLGHGVNSVVWVQRHGVCRRARVVRAGLNLCGNSQCEQSRVARSDEQSLCDLGPARRRAACGKGRALGLPAPPGRARAATRRNALGVVPATLGPGAAKAAVRVAQRVGYSRGLDATRPEKPAKTIG